MNSAQPDTDRKQKSPEAEREVPVEFAAFCALYRDRYREYAHSRLDDAGQADTAVRLAFAELADQWDQALRSPNTNAYAWQLLNRHLRTHTHVAEEAERDGQEESVSRAGLQDRSFLPDHADGARILHQDLGMPLPEASELMGHTTPRPR
ncbi:hypothetical protein [Streptomyces oryzae]|uniref:hypothetical protein n=1 Tax=Streptomyces oryzae TaxID=1434886 RepID=UPI0027DCA2A4|nr:hypothetical protein [Streptomyces oryzae]